MFSTQIKNRWNRTVIATGAKWLLAVVLATFVGSLEKASAQPVDEQAIFNDLRHTLLVRAALLKDQELAELELGVKVENRIAYLWGSVPSSTLLERAQKTVEQLPDILEVRSKLYVEAPLPMSFFIPGPASPLPADEASIKAEFSPKSEKEPMGNLKTSWHKPEGNEEKTSLKPTSIDVTLPSEDQGLFVLPAIAVPSSPLGGPGLLQSAAPKTVAERVQELKQHDTRLQFLRFLVQEHRVYLEGEVYQWNDLHQFAKAVAQLPGVENVVIGQVKLRK